MGGKKAIETTQESGKRFTKKRLRQTKKLDCKEGGDRELNLGGKGIKERSGKGQRDLD